MASSGSDVDKELEMKQKGFNHADLWCTDSFVPKVLIAPPRYVQGNGTTDHLGKYLQILPSINPGIYLSKGCRKRMESRLLKSFENAKISPQWIEFTGECSYDHVNTVYKEIQNNNKNNSPDKSKIDCIVSIGGGKCIDAGKLLSFYLNIPFVSFPSIASNDSPCSALSIMYTKDHCYECGVTYPMNPNMVIVDSGIVANAPVRYFIAGIGDAMATYFEAKTCYNNPKAKNMLGCRITSTALAMAELCCKTLFEYGMTARGSVEKKLVTDELEKCIEANVLLSGVGFESGGLAAAHAVAQGLLACVACCQRCNVVTL